MKGEAMSEERRAVHIAAVIMQAAGLCRYDSFTKCRRYFPTENDCTDCIEKWLIAKAMKEIKNGRARHGAATEPIRQ